jgi:hypothetical protein
VETTHCVAELHVTINYIKILSVVQQCFYGKYLTGNNPNYTILGGGDIPTNLHSFYTLHINAVLKQKNVRLRMALFRLQFG